MTGPAKLSFFLIFPVFLALKRKLRSFRTGGTSKNVSKVRLYFFMLLVNRALPAKFRENSNEKA